MNGALESILRIPPPFNMVVLIVLICTMAGVVTSIAKEIRKFACHRQEVAFKQELVDRGLATDEIERLIAANGPSRGDKRGSARST